MSQQEGQRTHSEPGPWDGAYRGAAPPWDIGRPQPVFVAVAEAGRIEAPVLDSGCGTGEQALFFASRGIEAVGVDFSPAAIERACAKAAERGIDATFVVHDVLDLRSLGRTFRTVIDSGTFHVFGAPGDVERYVAGLRAVLEPGGVVHLLCFSDRHPGVYGPKRVSQAEIRAAFGDGWSVESIDPATFDVNPPIGDAHAWLARIARLPGSSAADDDDDREHADQDRHTEEDPGHDLDPSTQVGR